MTESPLETAALHRQALEAALCDSSVSAQDLLALSQQLDQIINLMMRVRHGRFVRRELQAVRRRPARVTRALP